MFDQFGSKTIVLRAFGYEDQLSLRLLVNTSRILVMNWSHHSELIKSWFRYGTRRLIAMELAIRFGASSKIEDHTFDTFDTFDTLTSFISTLDSIPRLQCKV